MNVSMTTLESAVDPRFESINRGHDAVFRPGRLSLGLVVPLESYAHGPVPHARPQPIHLGLRLGAHHLRTYLRRLQAIGVNHVALNLRFNQAATEYTLKRLAAEVLPEFAG